MNQLQYSIETDCKDENWKIGTAPSVLEDIHQNNTNISIYERDISQLASEIEGLLNENIEVRLSGDVQKIMSELTQVVSPNSYSLILQDINNIMKTFSEVAGSSEFRFLLATINTNLCRRFHTDLNTLRMLCTYSGPGTLWLTNNNVNQSSLNKYEDNKLIVLDETKIQQAKTGALVLLKGAMYPQSEVKAIVHRSPTIEESGSKRLLLRIDTNDLFNF